jgi:two-component system cell cycle response regulator
MGALGIAVTMPRSRVTPSVRGSRARVIRLVRAGGVLGLAAYAAHSWLGFGGRELAGVFENWVFNALFVMSAILCLLRGLWFPDERAAWVSLGIGLGTWSIGELLYTIDPGQLASGTFPAPSDYLWLAFYPATFLALGLLVRARSREFYPSLWLDGIVGALAVAAVAWQFAMPAIVSQTGGSLGAVIGDLIYPVADLLLLGFAVGAVAITGWRPGRVLGLVAAAVAVGAIADVLSLYMSANGDSGSSAFDALWPASALLLGVAAWTPARPAGVAGLQGRRLVVLPLAFATAAVVLLVVQRVRPLAEVSYLLAVATVVGVVVRMAFTFLENLQLVARSRHEALTDPLTGLGNRRQLMLALADALQSASARQPWALILFDLNGFKLYNDSFGHPAGDALLVRLGAKLSAAVAPEGHAFRLGGDEFCVLAQLGDRTVDELAGAAVGALAERGEGFEISTACGAIELPGEAADASGALRLADQRLYANKRRAPSIDEPEQLRRVLLQVLAEHQPGLPEHLRDVAEMAQAVGRAVGLEGEELETLVRAAELHDVGKVAVPEAILNKPAALEPTERALVERHSEAGERILAAAAAMVPVARLVRASHERFDGGGYPDRRAGAAIPLGARIIAVCDAFHAMTGDRPYRRRMDGPEAIAELRRGAGTQFDPDVVELFCAEYEAGHLSPAPDPELA